MHDIILTLYYHAYWLIPVAALILVISWLLDRIIELL